MRPAEFARGHRQRGALWILPFRSNVTFKVPGLNVFKPCEGETFTLMDSNRDLTRLP